VESASELQAEEQADSVEPQRRRSWQQLAVAAVIGAVVLTAPIATPNLRQWYVRTTAMRDLTDKGALKDRLIEPRLTGGFTYGEWHVTRGGGGPDEDDTDRAHQQLLKEIAEDKARLVLIKTETDHSSDAAHIRGIAALLRHENDRAIAELTTVTQKRPKEAQAWSDLAAAYLQKQQYKEAIDTANRALALDPDLNEARFNKALATSRSKPAQLTAAWNEYLQHDSTSPWANEARERIESDKPLQ